MFVHGDISGCHVPPGSNIITTETCKRETALAKGTEKKGGAQSSWERE